MVYFDRCQHERTVNYKVYVKSRAIGEPEPIIVFPKYNICLKFIQYDSWIKVDSILFYWDLQTHL